MYVRCEFGLVGWLVVTAEHGCETVSCAFTFTKHRAGQHTKTGTGDTEELNSEGNVKRRRQRESREQWR